MPIIRASGGGAPAAHASTHEPGGSDDLFMLYQNLLSAGAETMPRHCAGNSVQPSTAVGKIWLASFTPLVSGAVTTFRLCTGGTARAGTATLVKLGLYTVSTLDTTASYTLVAQTANNTALASVANTDYSQAIAFQADGTTALSSYTLAAGTRYAVGYLEVGSTTAGSFKGSSFGAAAIPGLTPVLCRVTSAATYTDLTGNSPLASASLASTGFMMYVALQ